MGKMYLCNERRQTQPKTAILSRNKWNLVRGKIKANQESHNVSRSRPLFTTATSCKHVCYFTTERAYLHVPPLRGAIHYIALMEPSALRLIYINAIAPPRRTPLQTFTILPPFELPLPTRNRFPIYRRENSIGVKLIFTLDLATFPRRNVRKRRRN